MVYRFVILRERTLLFFVEVKGHLRLPEVNLQKPLKWLVHTETTVFIVVETRGHVRSPEVKDCPSGVTRGQKANFPRIPKIFM